MKGLLCDILFSCLLMAPGAKPIDELTYGGALYAYYQEDYQQALLEVMVAQRRARTGDDPLRFELAKGSFAFQEGMYRFASETFAGVAAAELSELDRMRLAFHLSREHHRRGDWPALEEQLGRIDLGANWRGRLRRHPEVSFMEAEAALARGDFAAAETALAALPERDPYRAYGLFNLGVSQRQAGDSAAARDAFGRLAELQVDTEEAWDLVQRGRLALAMMAREEGEAVDAEALLGTLPGASRYRSLALASYANLAMAREDHELAARIWLTLLKQDDWGPSRAAAQLGLPMSLEKLASPAHALERYREAEQVFDARLVSLQQTAVRAADPGWMDGLLDAFADPDPEARATRLAGLDQGLGTATWLEWLSGEDVHQVLVEWRELTGMAGWLTRLPPRIAAYQEITRERRRRAAAAGALLSDEQLAGRRVELAEQVSGLEAELAALRDATPVPEPQWMYKLANDEETSQIDELTALADRATAQMPPDQRPAYQARIRRLLGLVFWQIAEERAARLRELDKRVTRQRELLADVDRRIERLAGAESRFAAGVETDFLALTGRAEQVSERVAGALDVRRRRIARALEHGLEQEMARTRQYLLTARVAIARATDQLASSEAAAAADSGGAVGAGES